MKEYEILLEDELTIRPLDIEDETPSLVFDLSDDDLLYTVCSMDFIARGTLDCVDLSKEYLDPRTCDGSSSLTDLTVKVSRFKHNHYTVAKKMALL